jgi:SecD/SecF fusion protein
LFSDVFIKQNGNGKLSSLFAGPGKEVKIDDNDEAVITKIRTIGKGAINQTYKILVKRIDKFGVAQPIINLDENKGVINVELAGVNDPARVRKFLQSSANLQFWEVYQIDEIANSLKLADDNLKNYLNGVSVGDTAKANDSTLAKKNLNPFFKFSVFKFLASGKSISEIADSMFLSANTISTYRSRILLKMNMKNNTELTVYCIEQKLI